jgi:hypothetical protein
MPAHKTKPNPYQAGLVRSKRREMHEMIPKIKSNHQINCDLISKEGEIE